METKTFIGIKLMQAVHIGGKLTVVYTSAYT